MRLDLEGALRLIALTREAARERDARPLAIAVLDGGAMSSLWRGVALLCRLDHDGAPRRWLARHQDDMR